MTAPEQVQLLPCPFCGGPPQMSAGGPGLWYVRCEGCTASTDDGSRKRAERLWNTRHRHTATAEALEAMREAREALEYCKVEAYCSVDAECGSVDRYGYGRIETNAREVLTRLTAAIAKIEGDTK